MDLGHLNPPQRAAVTHASGPLLVLAGAGSGKTRVITHRIAHLLGGGIDARHVAALTFTNKASAEMRERVALLVGDRQRAGELTMGTFHSLGLQVLRAERSALGFPRGFVIYDTADQLGVIREILRRIYTGRRFDVKAILTRISLAKNAFISPEAYEPSEVDDYDEITAEVYPKYERALRAFAAVDFDDLITKPVQLWREHSEVGEKWRRRFAHVLVDEFQDTNRAQLLMVQHLVHDHHNLCVVGDDDQSIYSWRGADPRNILDFQSIYPKATVIKLEQNYRSTPTILDAANAVIAHNSDRHGKELWSQKPRGGLIHHVKAPSAEAEARFVATEIRKLRDEGSKLRHIAVLYRSNKQTATLEEELRTHEIPYVMYGGQQFFERKEVKDVIAYLRAVLNPRDEISLRRIINYPARGIGVRALERLTALASERRVSLGKALEIAVQESNLLPAPAWRAVSGFVELLSGFRQRIESSTDYVSDVEWLVDAIDLIGDLRSASPSIPAAQRRIDNLEVLKRSLARHQQRSRGGLAALDEFLRHLSLEGKDDEGQNEVGNRVVLTTLHGAKGLEFPVVFLIGLEEELLPHARTLMPIATDVTSPEHCVNVSEERRLAYVGITRAMETLYLCRCRMRRLRGKDVPRTPSRFLLEIPDELLVERDVVAEAKVAVPTDEVRNFFAQMGGLID